MTFLTNIDLFKKYVSLCHYRMVQCLFLKEEIINPSNRSLNNIQRIILYEWCHLSVGCIMYETCTSPLKVSWYNRIGYVTISSGRTADDVHYMINIMYVNYNTTKRLKLQLYNVFLLKNICFINRLIIY